MNPSSVLLQCALIPTKHWSQMCPCEEAVDSVLQAPLAFGRHQSSRDIAMRDLALNKSMKKPQATLREGKSSRP